MATANALPTIDLTPLREGSAADKRAVACEIDDACTEIGFFLVAGHGVAQRLIAETRQAAVDFFALPHEEKMRVQRPPAKISRGYNWVGDRSLSYSLGQPAPPDIQEAFAFGPDGAAELARQVDPAAAQMYAPNIWPERPHNFKETMVRYYDAMAGLASTLLQSGHHHSLLRELRRPQWRGKVSANFGGRALPWQTYEGRSQPTRCQGE